MGDDAFQQLGLEQNNYVLDADESEGRHTHAHTQVLVLLCIQVSPRCNLKVDGLPLETFFHNLWQLAIRLADKKYTVNIHKCADACAHA